MPLPTKRTLKKWQLGVSLIEMVIFIVIVSVAMIPLISADRQAMMHNVDPLIRIRAVEAAQSLLDEILALKYDEQTPTGGIPACSSVQAGSVACNNNPDSNRNDVDDYQGWSDVPYTGYARSVRVTTNANIKLVEVSVTTPTGETILLAAERANF
ncbi:MSHA biogenesis protein MshD [Cellvibrio sp. KY-GH-1]|uniref:type IV pilus modification PilV family protein n=1 Tax=Cellvibrio sp. KY-GH-1 TaxID=2303332 RepID=UPI001247F29D|nr:MSHA biogenesis protein MshD [Cellvibrio sp. KY-GH-1]QEY14776.1 MSHA biogenesis protein MshD [Cellvibrio sp. KY-GH-1]